MKFVTYAHAQRVSYGLLLEDAGVFDLPQAAEAKGAALPPTLLELIEVGPGALAIVRTLATAGVVASHAAADVDLLAPIPHPRKNVFCVGLNYREHVAEQLRVIGRETRPPEFPQFFTKPGTAVIGPGGAFPLDQRVTSALDYEVELAVVVGTRGRDISRAQALEHVFGLTVVNDLTARDLQRRHGQWFKGKALDASCPVGPCIVTLDEFPDLAALELTTTVNGEGRQRARVGQMIFDIPEIIAQLSLGMTLDPGDIIATGTPSGVGYAMNPPSMLVSGDVVDCAITGIGHLVTRIVSATT